MNERERIIRIMNEEKMNASQFSEYIGIQRAAISHIIAGRNKPSLDVIKKILNKFSSVNPDWLLSGEGHMRRNASGDTNVTRDMVTTSKAGSTPRDPNRKPEDAASGNSTKYKNGSPTASRDLFSQPDFLQSTPPAGTRPATGNPLVADRNANRTTQAQNRTNPADARAGLHFSEEKTQGDTVNYTANQLNDLIKETVLYKERTHKTIEKLLIFYSDNTFETFIPEKNNK
jgi:DNA-binding XRE family transcriptional regulator